MRSDWFQYTLIGSGIIATVLFGIFLKKELFPEYKIYQNDYVALENFRSTYSHEPVVAFQEGIKQIVFERRDNGPPGMERCTSCHVALDIPYFSPTKLKVDEEGHHILDAEKRPIQVPNEEYIWKKLDEKIEELTDAAFNAQLQKEGHTTTLKLNLALAEQYRALKTAHVDDYIYDVTKVLRMHPLIGRETRPFEFHPLTEYGCISCHSGNGQGLTTEKAHGPVFDGQYDIEFEGPEPKFTEEDPLNDPSFASQFNHKPGPSLIFQTTPIYTGALIQAKCMSCHHETREKNSTSQPPIQNPLKTSDAHLLTLNYQRGQELFLSQGCYACHKIAGFTRGGVGPELTREGLSYPWFIKQSIVWPQADLPTSTMPNYRLDHEELQDLMTYLLGQVGEKNNISPVDYKTQIQEWEAGKKMPWEMSVTPGQAQDVRYGMKVFATEGCAACHRLMGFDSDVGYHKELEEKPKFETLFREHEWFKGIIPEEIVGSSLVKVLETHGKEIDQHIVKEVRKGSTLEEIEKENPNLIESFYTPFKYAARAKNHELQSKAAKEKDPIKKAAILKALEQWKDRVHRVLMMYVQEYGLGRLVCPPPNWSGVYRSDEWLMEHFHNPSSHVARSIMPVFPFDDSKFYALTHMLDVIGMRNRNQIREVWEKNGFNPSLAYETHCAHCHGEYKEGDGPIAPWLYPIPKNLNNAEFLRNLTKERVIQSITHGVKGTPMPPWGEVGVNKPYLKDIPVLKAAEIKQLVDWLFSNLPGAEVIRDSKDVEKWKYSPEDVIKELLQEGNQIKGKSDKSQKSAFILALPKGEGLLASLQPMVISPPSEAKNSYVEALFEKKTSPTPETEPIAYYIRKEYYTPENIAAGRHFFEINCAVCHGNEADGMGARAEFMKDAKPRMLINLDWLKTRDDLRLLRSIKYGVPGTAMNPWGDFTSSLQRLQLVIYIRSLSEQHLYNDRLTETLYQIFNPSLEAIEQERSYQYPALSEAKVKYDSLVMEREKNYQAYQASEEQSKKILELYQQELTALTALKKREALDETLKSLSVSLNHEKEVYQRLGNIFHNFQNESNFKTFLHLVSLNSLRYVFDDNKLIAHFQLDEESKQQADLKALTDTIDESIEKLEKKQIVVQAKIVSVERSTELNSITAEINALKKFKLSLISGLQEAKKFEKEQQKLYQISLQETTGKDTQ